MNNYILLLIFILIKVLSCSKHSLNIPKPTPKYVAAFIKDGQIILKEGNDDIGPEDWVARASFVDLTFYDGWSYLEVDTKAAFGDDLLQSYGAGYCEGSITNKIIYNSWSQKCSMCLNLIWEGDVHKKCLRHRKCISRSTISWNPVGGRECKQMGAMSTSVESPFAVAVAKAIFQWRDDNNLPTDGNVDLPMRRCSRDDRNTQEGFCNWKGEEYCKNLRNFLSKNIDWMKSQIRDKRTIDPIWHHVELVLSQLKGLSDGYNNASLNSISLEDLLLMNLSGDLESLDNILDPKKQNVTFQDWVNSKEKLGDGHCSALIKVLPRYSDLFVSQDTWNTYQSMLRIQKKYNFQFHHVANSKSSVLIPGQVSVFSSYPAYLSSGDDFYVLSSGLATLETTIGNSNPELWKYVTPEGELMEWIRAIVANRLATSGKKWSEIFKQYNSGTYNNQWMIVDYKLFKPGKPIRPNTLWVLEQLPGTIMADDQSELLKKQTYFASYNTPFYPNIFNMSGSPALVEKYGDWFSYDKTPRALIFKRNQTMVTDLDSMIKLMRYNNFKEDPLSRCNCTPPYSGENAISARNDLNPKNGSYPFAALGHRSHGGTDMKVTSFKRFRKMRFVAVNGPTYDQLPAFKWSDQDFANSTPHFGHPDEFKFPLVEHKWIWGH